jgi:hypothetical protein
MTPKRIILHHSLTEDGATVSWGAIRNWHMGLHPDSPYREKPMRDIGYHFGIELAGSRHEVLLGRMPDAQGAHALGQNSDSIGICFVGNFDLAPPYGAQWALGLKLVAWLCRNFRIPAGQVLGHRDFASKSCPGKMFDVARFVRELKGGLK